MKLFHHVINVVVVHLKLVLTVLIKDAEGFAYVWSIREIGGQLLLLLLLIPQVHQLDLVAICLVALIHGLVFLNERANLILHHRN